MVSCSKVCLSIFPHIICDIYCIFVQGQYENTLGSTMFINVDVKDGVATSGEFDSVTEKKLVMSRCLLSKRNDKEEFFTGEPNEQG